MSHFSRCRLPGRSLRQLWIVVGDVRWLDSLLVSGADAPTLCLYFYAEFKDHFIFFIHEFVRQVFFTISAVIATLVWVLVILCCIDVVWQPRSTGVCASCWVVYNSLTPQTYQLSCSNPTLQHLKSIERRPIFSVTMQP